MSKFLHDNQCLLTPAVCIAATVAWVDFGLWPVWVAAAVILWVLPTVLDRRRAKAEARS